MTLARKVGRYIATDQGYVFKGLRWNLEENTKARGTGNRAKDRVSNNRTHPGTMASNNIDVLALDWEIDQVGDLAHLLGLKRGSGNVDMVVACDCIYNETLIEPLVRTCAELCHNSDVQKPTFCVIAQQLRSHAVFETWLIAFHGVFRVWRIPDHLLTEGLKAGSGYAVHVGVLRSSN